MRLHRFEFRAMASSHELLLAGTDAMLAAHVPARSRGVSPTRASSGGAAMPEKRNPNTKAATTRGNFSFISRTVRRRPAVPPTMRKPSCSSIGNITSSTNETHRASHSSKAAHADATITAPLDLLSDEAAELAVRAEICLALRRT